MGMNKLASLLAATLLCVAPAILCGEKSAEAATLKLSVDSVDYEPGGHLGVEVVTEGFIYLVVKSSDGITISPSEFSGGTASIKNGEMHCEIDRPGVDVLVKFTAWLPNVQGKKLVIKVEGVTDTGAKITRSYPLWTKKMATPAHAEVVSPPRVALAEEDTNSGNSSQPEQGQATPSGPRSIFSDDYDPAPDPSNNVLTNGRVVLNFVHNQDLASLYDKNLEQRTYTNMEMSLLERITPATASPNGNFDLGVQVGNYNTENPNSRSSEILASEGSSSMRASGLSRFYTENTAVELGLGVNSNAKNQNQLLSGTLSWSQKIPQALDWIALPGRTVENTARVVVSGFENKFFTSLSLRDQLDIPIDIPKNPKGRSHLYLSLGTIHNAKWEHAGDKSSWMDWQTWGGFTIKFGALNASVGLAKPENGFGVYTDTSLTLEGPNRKIR